MSFHVVVHTPDVVGGQMAGPGIRALHLARELAKEVPTTLIAQLDATANGAPASAGAFRFLNRHSPEARRALRDASVLIGQPSRGFFKRRREQRIIYDLFDPTVLELRELYGSSPSLRQRVHLAAECGGVSAARSFWPTS